MSDCRTYAENRIEWIDALKGFAIILVIIGHTTISVTNKETFVWIYSFHMPLFFCYQDMFTL